MPAGGCLPVGSRAQAGSAARLLLRHSRAGGNFAGMLEATEASLQQIFPLKRPGKNTATVKYPD